MAAPKVLTELPESVAAILGVLGVSANKLLEFWNELAERTDLPEDWTAQVQDWIGANITANLSPESAMLLVQGVIAELVSGAPGYDKDHGRYP